MNQTKNTENSPKEGGTLHLILAEAALELLPESLYQSKSVKRNLKKYGNPARLLDTSLHHQQMHTLPNSEKRGRPDILHRFLLDALGSPANAAHKIRIIFATEERIFEVSPEMRCPRNYLRFKGLMVQLLKLGHIPPESPYFVFSTKKKLSNWIEENFEASQVYKFTSKGKNLSLESTTAEMAKKTKSNEDVAVLIGGFQKGHFSKSVANIPGSSVSIHKSGLDSWIVVQRVLAGYEERLSLI